MRSNIDRRPAQPGKFADQLAAVVRISVIGLVVAEISGDGLVRANHLRGIDVNRDSVLSERAGRSQQNNGKKTRNWFEHSRMVHQLLHFDSMVSSSTDFNLCGVGLEICPTIYLSPGFQETESAQVETCATRPALRI